DDEAHVAVVLLGVSGPRGPALPVHGPVDDLPGGGRRLPALEVLAVEGAHAAGTGCPRLGRDRSGVGGRRRDRARVGRSAPTRAARRFTLATGAGRGAAGAGRRTTRAHGSAGGRLAAGPFVRTSA